jgi:hypothetical protein
MDGPLQIWEKMKTATIFGRQNVQRVQQIGHPVTDFGAVSKTLT